MKSSFYADMHCHPQGRSFNYFRNNPSAITKASQNLPKQWSPWVLPDADGSIENWSKQLKGKRPGHFSQADFNRLAAGNVRLVFASLYPLEKGFVTGKVSTGFGQLLHALLKPFSFLSENNTLRALVQSLQMRYPAKRIRFFQGKTSEPFNYWEETKAEYYFLAAHDGVQQEQTFKYFSDTCNSDRHANTTHQIHAFQLNHRYEIVQSKEHLETLISDIEKTNNCIAVVLTIEGGHVFSTDSSDKLLSWPAIHKRLLELKNWGRKISETDAEKKDLNNIHALKEWMDQATGTYLHNPIFILNLSHHFNNYLACHARSLPDKLRLLMDQSEGMFEEDAISKTGRQVIECCLNIKCVKNGNDILIEEGFQGNRILIDVKHMSPAARAIYYRDYIIPHNTKHPENKIPVVATHAGVVGPGYETLETLKEQDLNCLIKDVIKQDVTKFNFTSWGINMCLEDIKVIVQSGGIIALSLDQRILGNPGGKSGTEDFARNLQYIISEAKQHGFVSEEINNSIWDSVAIASDFDGFIDPIDECPSAICFEQFHDLLKKHLSKEAETFFEPYTIDICLEKLFGLNTYNFTRNYFPR
ncbi:hypothetical protein [Cytophaga hutchinsonii]|uniref:Membrane dipeptidase (Peptidase family M19) n=1 Tax=Cytophaga hutchinsonii (strain ATCC 33406 / DSM 1761 / CIP 103989 / NBRC 15051 / NCIMB 9469 / D465) TaxID=269798 RepID=A0A6N4SMY4_CYTH3|nr:hypothetical protein [Cytophaga hutchinsonii]ABG57641.1 hypothetical protein CHU_0351 [Cytophaga hutchinsonii ATCC 33406]SFX01778.1 hypothetical protein SAMN04487930_101201 [Cytophaga hutchinsonii ATCC 33406]